MRTFFLLTTLIIFSCDSYNSSKISDLESLQLKTSFVDLYENNIDLSVYKGKRVIINYWATWCRPCIKELPSIKIAEEILEDYGYIFLLVSDSPNTSMDRDIIGKVSKVDDSNIFPSDTAIQISSVTK